MEPVTILAAISAVVSVASAIYASTLVGDSSPEDSGATVTKTGVTATKNPVYGRCRIGSVNVYNNVSDHNSSWLLSVFTMGIGPLNAIHQVYIDDVPVIIDGNYATDPNGGRNQLIFDGKGNFDSQDVRIQLRSGLETEIAMGLAIDNSDGEWTANHRGDRCGQVAVLVRRVISDEGARIMSKQFSVTATVSGISVYDPRIHTDPSQKAYSRNTALCILDYITNDYYGMGIPYKYIDVDSFIECANWIDANELYIDAEIDSSQTFSSILSKMIACFGGIITAEDGYVKLKYEDIAAPKYHFDESNIIGDGVRVTNQNSSGYYNVVETSYKNFKTKEREDIYTLPQSISNDARIARDGYIKSTKLELPYVLDCVESTNPTKGVKLLTNRAYNRSNFQKKLEFNIDLEEYPVVIYDVIEVSNEHYGWDKKKWRVVGKNKTVDDENLNVCTLSCDEYDDSIYTGSSDGGSGNPIPLPPSLTAPTNIQFNQQTYITFGYGELSWSSTSFGQSNETQVEYKRQSDSGWTKLGSTQLSIWKVSNLSPDVYMFRVRTYNPAVGTSPWGILDNVVIAPNVILPEVTGANANTESSNFVFFWDSMLDSPVSTPSGPDNGGTDGTVKSWFQHYQVDIKHWNGSGYDYKASYTTVVPEFVYTLLENSNNGINRRVRAEVYIVAKDGTKSQLGTNSSYNALNQQHPAPNGVEINTELSNMLITWDKSTELDFDHTNIYASTVQGFIPSNANLIAQPIGTLFSKLWVGDETRYIRIAHNDVFGSDSEILSPEYVSTPKTIEDVLPTPVDELNKIRDPSDPLTNTGEYVGNVVSNNKRVVTGFGMFADDSGQSDFIVAADRFMVGAGGHAVWSDGINYVIGDRVFVYNASTKQTDLYEAIADNTNQTPPNPTYWKLIKSNVDQVVFSVDATGKVLIKNAVIENLSGSKITANSITATQIKADTITANEIAANTITANEIAANTITGDLIKANTKITSPIIDGGKIIAGSGGFGETDTGGFPYNGKNYNTVIEDDGTLKTNRIQATDGTFGGTIRAEQIIGDIVKAIPVNIPNRTLPDNVETTVFSYTLPKVDYDRAVQFPCINAAGQVVTANFYVDGVVVGSSIVCFSVFGSGGNTGAYVHPLIAKDVAHTVAITLTSTQAGSVSPSSGSLLHYLIK